MFRSFSRPFALRRRLPLRFETLEGREVPAVFQVTSLADNGAGTLRAAINLANSNSDPDLIKIEVAGTIALTSGQLGIFNDVVIVGPGSGLLTIDATNNGGNRIFNIGTEGVIHTSISGMTLANADVTGNTGGSSGGAIRTYYGPNMLSLADVIISNCNASRGGAIDLGGGDTLVMDNCTVSGNNASNRGGGIFLGNQAIGQFRDSTISGNATSADGGGIYASSYASVSIERCTIAGNFADPTEGSSNGAGLFADQAVSLNIQDSTFSDNSAAGDGGGIFISDGDFTINNSTISGNTAAFEGGGIFVGAFQQTPGRRPAGGNAFNYPAEILHCTITGNVAQQSDSGGGVFTNRSIEVVNSIIAGNTAFPGPEIFTANGATINLSFSLIFDKSGATINDIGGNIFNQNALLGPLANNGGKTKTHALLTGSPAIDTGDPAFQNPPVGNDVPVFDQRGTTFPRVVTNRTDMGAYEFQPGFVPPPPEVHVKFSAVGADAGTTTWVKVYDAAGNFVVQFEAYPTYQFGVRVATADINGDGIDDIITAPGAGGGPHIQVFDGSKLTANFVVFPDRIVNALGSFYSYNPFFTGGVYVAAADVNGDGRTDIITGADAGGGPHVIAWDSTTGRAITSFYAYAPNWLGGVRVGGGDLDGDGKAEIITGAGPGGGPHVRAFSSTGALVKDFFAYDAAFRGGVYVAAGDVNDDGRADIITGAGAGGGPHVKVFSGVDLAVLRSFNAYETIWPGGVRVASFDFDNDGFDDIVTGAGPGGGPHVAVYSGANLSLLKSYYAWDLPFQFGVFVG